MKTMLNRRSPRGIISLFLHFWVILICSGIPLKSASFLKKWKTKSFLSFYLFSISNTFPLSLLISFYILYVFLSLFASHIFHSPSLSLSPYLSVYTNISLCFSRSFSLPVSLPVSLSFCFSISLSLSLLSCFSISLSPFYLYLFPSLTSYFHKNLNHYSFFSLGCS